MPPLPVLSGAEVIRIFEKFGWQVVRRKGSHVVMTKHGQIVTLSIPDHKEVARGTLRGLIKMAGLTIDQFCSACR